MKKEIQDKLIPLRLRTYADVVERALDIEASEMRWKAKKVQFNYERKGSSSWYSRDNRVITRKNYGPRSQNQQWMNQFKGNA